MKRTLIAFFAILLTASCGFARQPERGYRGFVDWTNRIYNNDYDNHTDFCPGLSTSHGYQFNSWLFAGVGIDYSLEDCGYYIWNQNDKQHYHLHYDPTNYFLSIFADVRTDLQFGKFTPFADLRIGLNANSYGTLYLSPSIGYRFNWGRKLGVNIGIGYTLDAYRYEIYDYGVSTDGYNIFVPTGKYRNFNQSSFTFRVGIDF